MSQLFIYQPGQPGCQTTVTTGADGKQYADFTFEWQRQPDGSLQAGPNKLAADYLLELNAKRIEGTPEFSVITWDELDPQAIAAQNAAFTAPWEETTEERFDYWLNVLPPEAYEVSNGVTIFRMSEYTTSNITQHVASCQGRFFVGSFRTSRSHAEHIKTISALCI